MIVLPKMSRIPGTMSLVHQEVSTVGNAPTLSAVLLSIISRTRRDAGPMTLGQDASYSMLSQKSGTFLPEKEIHHDSRCRLYRTTGRYHHQHALTKGQGGSCADTHKSRLSSSKRRRRTTDS